MPANVAFTLRMPADKPQLAELIASYRDFNVDETLLAPDDSALQHWYHWLLEHESGALFAGEANEPDGDTAVLDFMPECPEAFAEAMLHLLTALGATDLSATIWTLDSDDGIQWQLHLADGELVSQEVTI